MADLLDLFSANILPLFLTAGAGFLIGKALDIDPRTLSRVVFYIFSPCLVFQLLTQNQLNNHAIVQMTAYAFGFTALIGILTWVIGRAVKLERSFLTAILLTTMFTNAGNFGLSLNSFAFGDDVLAFASLYFVSSATMIYTLGVVIASMGTASLKDALLGLFKLPTMYALLLAFAFLQFGWSLPLPVERSVTLLGDAAIPSMLVLLGLQLQRATKTSNLPALGLANGLRLIGAPLVAIGLAMVFGLRGPARQAGIIEASMPSAVMTTVLATEYNIEPAFVTTVVTTTTLLSPLTLTPLLAFLGS